MQGIGIKQYGDESQLGEITIPARPLEQDELRISIKASGVNPVDWKVREGLLKDDFPYKLPLILGWDGAGVVREVGKAVTAFEIGDAVFFRPEMDGHGTYADEIIVKANIVAKKPETISFSEAAAVPLVGLTSWQALVEFGRITKGMKVLILAGSGGIGTTAIQIAKALGADVATTTSKKNEGYVKQLGADQVLLYDQGPLSSETSFDFIFDTLGGQAYVEALPLLKDKGTVATIIGERDAVTAEGTEMLEQQKDIRKQFVFTRPDGTNMEQLKELIEAGQLKPAVTNVFPLTVSGVKEAHLLSQSGRARGKIVLSFDEAK